MCAAGVKILIELHSKTKSIKNTIAYIVMN